jgi:CxxC motif-containing protein (DUF1111 family)
LEEILMKMAWIIGLSVSAGLAGCGDGASNKDSAAGAEAAADKFSSHLVVANKQRGDGDSSNAGTRYGGSDRHEQGSTRSEKQGSSDSQEERSFKYKKPTFRTSGNDSGYGDLNRNRYGYGENHGNHETKGIFAVDPGVRGGMPGAGGPLPNLTAQESMVFRASLGVFNEVNTVSGDDPGLGPRFNSNSCVSCHSQPATGGTSPLRNPLFAVARLAGADNIVPWFIAPNGPIREARFIRHSNGLPDGNVTAIFTITGRSDAAGCNIAQPNFLPAGNPLTGQGGNRNLIFRIPTPVFGAGLIEAIPDSVILANMNAQASVKATFGISGRPNSILSGNVNRSANDGTITRFGWKAQNKSLLLFSGEAYNVEQGVTNELFPDERDQTPGCILNPTPEDIPNFDATTAVDALPDLNSFTNFMRLLAAPTPAPDTPTIVRGRAVFNTIGCAACHTPTLTTGRLINIASAARANQKVNLYSDLLVHNMGVRLADGITQGAAGPEEFRTAPLWGLGQRAFFMHDGRTSDLVEAILVHRSSGSEASRVVDNFEWLGPDEQQDLLNFLRAL